MCFRPKLVKAGAEDALTCQCGQVPVTKLSQVLRLIMPPGATSRPEEEKPHTGSAASWGSSAHVLLGAAQVLAAEEALRKKRRTAQKPNTFTLVGRGRSWCLVVEIFGISENDLDRSQGPLALPRPPGSTWPPTSTSPRMQNHGMFFSVRVGKGLG